MGKRIGVLHGAIKNSGDFLIYKRGMQLLRKYLDGFELIEIKRWEEFDDDVEVDALIILGGPIVSRGMNQQIRNIKNTLRKQVPIIALGVGVSGERFNDIKNYFKDEETKEFWKIIYKSSNLISVRDIITLKVFESYGIKAYFTGCPALYDLSIVQEYLTKLKNLNGNSQTKQY